MSGCYNRRQILVLTCGTGVCISAIVRLGLRDFEKQFDKSEDDIKALQSVGQIIGEVLKQLDEERCMYFR